MLSCLGMFAGNVQCYLLSGVALMLCFLTCNTCCECSLTDLKMDWQATLNLKM